MLSLLFPTRSERKPLINNELKTIVNNSDLTTTIPMNEINSSDLQFQNNLANKLKNKANTIENIRNRNPTIENGDYQPLNNDNNVYISINDFEKIGKTIEPTHLNMESFQSGQYTKNLAIGNENVANYKVSNNVLLPKEGKKELYSTELGTIDTKNFNPLEVIEKQRKLNIDLALQNVKNDLNYFQEAAIKSQSPIVDKILSFNDTNYAEIAKHLLIEPIKSEIEKPIIPGLMNNNTYVNDIGEVVKQAVKSVYNINDRLIGYVQPKFDELAKAILNDKKGKSSDIIENSSYSGQATINSSTFERIEGESRATRIMNEFQKPISNIISGIFQTPKYNETENNPRQTKRSEIIDQLNLGQIQTTKRLAEQNQTLELNDVKKEKVIYDQFEFQKLNKKMNQIVDPLSQTNVILKYTKKALNELNNYLPPASRSYNLNDPNYDSYNDELVKEEVLVQSILYNQPTNYSEPIIGNDTRSIGDNINNNERLEIMVNGLRETKKSNPYLIDWEGNFVRP